MNVKNKFTMKNKIGAKLAMQGMAENFTPQNRSYFMNKAKLGEKIWAKLM
jgi:hypothetical protein